MANLEKTTTDSQWHNTLFEMDIAARAEIAFNSILEQRKIEPKLDVYASLSLAITMANKSQNYAQIRTMEKVLEILTEHDKKSSN